MAPVERHAPTPPLPPSFRKFAHPGYVNAYYFPKLQDERKLYCTETIPGLNDWNAPTLLMAQDAAPAQVIENLIKNGDPNPWRHSERGFGSATNRRVQELAGCIKGTKLYGSILAHMLREGGQLKKADLIQGPLHDHLRLVLKFVVGEMPNLQALVCLGNIPHQLVSSWTADVRAAAALKVGECKEVDLFGRRLLLCRLYHPSPRATNSRGGPEKRRCEWEAVPSRERKYSTTSGL